MKGITETQYNHLCKVCDSILKKEPVSFTRNANSLLNVIREHPIFLNIYKPIFYKNSFKFYFFILISFLKIIIVGILKFLDAIYRIYFLRDVLKRDQNNYSEIFITHFLNEEFIQHKNDFYFYKLPKKISRSKESSLNLYINFTNLSSNSVTNKWNKNVCSKLLPRYLPIFLELKIRIQLIKEAIKILKIRSKNNFEKRIKYYASIASLFSSTFNNYRLAIMVSNFIRKNNVEFIFTTYEGHAWERLIFGFARRINSKVKCIGYQHSIIFRKQHSIRRKLEKSFEPDYILCSGEHGFKQFKKINYLPDKRLILFGSKRGGNSVLKNLAVNSKHRKTFLLLPEGDLVECIPMVEFFISLAIKYQNYKFIIRFHPITRINKVLKKCPKLNREIPNLEISKFSLEDDFKRSQFAIYRGSTTIIKAVLYGLIPIYFSRSEEISIDPLFEFENKKINLSKPEDIEILEKISHNELISNQIKLIEHVKQFFSPINYDQVLKLKKIK